MKLNEIRGDYHQINIDSMVSLNFQLKSRSPEVKLKCEIFFSVDGVRVGRRKMLGICMNIYQRSTLFLQSALTSR